MGAPPRPGDGFTGRTAATGGVDAEYEEGEVDENEGGGDEEEEVEEEGEEEEEEEEEEAELLVEQEQEKELAKIPESMLRTDPNTGLTQQEFVLRQRRFGVNLLPEEKPRLIRKFLGYFTGPIESLIILAAVIAAGLQKWVTYWLASFFADGHAFEFLLETSHSHW
jgi:H+-transporting ATPase